MSIHKAARILGREWEKLRFYFESCGDIGNFNFEDIKNSGFLLRGEEGFISNVISMESKLPKYGYATPEALNVFTVLATIAVKKLGLAGELASAFGLGYASVRTGLLAHHSSDLKHVLFNKLFFPFGAVKYQWDLNAQLDVSLMKKKLEIVFDRFRGWQDNPQFYRDDLTLFQNMAEVWKAWDEI
jgi:hypothetical protein